MASATSRARAAETPIEHTALRNAAGCREFYQTRDVVEILGISRRQLQYWAQTGLLLPSATTRGGHRRYSFEDLVALKAAKRLIDAGVSLQRIRKSIQSLRETLPSVGQPLSELVLVATGDIVLVFREGSAFEAVSGQEWVFEVAAFEREVAGWSHPRETRRSQRDRTGRSRPSERPGPGDAAEPGRGLSQTA